MCIRDSLNTVQYVRTYLRKVYTYVLYFVYVQYTVYMSVYTQIDDGTGVYRYSDCRVVSCDRVTECVCVCVRVCVRVRAGMSVCACACVAMCA